MSTRTQVHVHNDQAEVTLYHHTDGYPSYMLPLIKRAWETYCQGWEGNRTGKVASALCAADPLVFEPQDSHRLHADIEYYYEIDCTGGKDTRALSDWLVTIYSTRFDFEGVMSKRERLHEMGTVHVSEITDEYIESIEDSE